MKEIRNRLLSILLTLTMLVGLLPAMAITAGAATNLDNGFEGQDADVFTALGFDTTVLPEGYDPDTTDNPFGRDKVTGNQVFELAVAGQTGSRLYGKGNNNVASSSISGIPGGTGVGMAMFATAAGDFDGDGLAGEIVYVGFDQVRAAVKDSNDLITVNPAKLQMKVYNGRTESFGSTKTLANEISPYYSLPQSESTNVLFDARVSLTEFDMYWQNLLQVTAGDYDGDGISEIAVYVGENQSARIDVYKYQKKSTSTEGDWIDTANWSRVWSHALNGEYAYVPNMISLVSADINRDGVDDLGIAYGSAVVNEQYLVSTVGRMEASKAVILWGDRAKMLQTSSPVDLDTENLGEQARVSLIFGDLNDDGAKELIATGQPVADMQSFATFFGQNIQTAGNSQRTIITYIYDLQAGLLINSSDLMLPIDGHFETNSIDGTQVTSWVSGNGFDQYYYSQPYMRTNAAVFKPEGAEYPYLYLDSCLYQCVQDTLSLKGEMDEKYDGENAFSLGSKYWGARMKYSDDSVAQTRYAEYGAASADINGNGYQILITNSFHYASNTENGHNNQYAVVNGTSGGKLQATITCPNDQYTDDYQGQALTFLDCDIDTVIMEYTGQHYLTYSDPKVLAVIAAAPYFEDVDEATGYEFAGNNTNSWGMTHGTGSAETISVDFSFGGWGNHELLGAGVKFAMEWGASFTLSYEHSVTTSYEYTMTFGTYGDQDAVAFFSVPTENYIYRILTPNEKNGYDVRYEPISNTYQPVFQVLTLDYYESIQGNYDELPPIAGEAITSTPGDPASYPSSSKGYDVIAEWDQDPAGVGFGNGSIEQEISISEEEETSYSLGAEVEFKIGGGQELQLDVGQSGFENTGGIQFSLNPAGGWADTTMKGTTIAAEVANMPLEFQPYGYYFNWKLFSYYYVFGDKGKESDDEEADAKIGRATSARIPVISFIVNDVAKPPELPDDFKQDYDRTTSDTNVLTWTYDKPVSAFIIYKQFDFPVGAGLQELARIAPGDAAHYRIKYDDEGQPYKEYFIEDTNLPSYSEFQYAIQVERLTTVPPLSTPSALVTARTKSADGYPTITVTESDDEQNRQLLVYPDKNAYLTAVVTGPEGQSLSNYYSVVQYQWQKQVKGAWQDLIGETNKTLTFASAGVDTAGDYRCRVNVITKADNVAITAYSDSVTLTHAKRTSYFKGVAVTDVAGGGVQLYAEVGNAHNDSASIPSGTVTFNLTSNATGQTYQFFSPLTAAGTAIAVLDQVLPEGMYSVEAYYSGSYIFKSCYGQTMYLSQRATGYDIDMPNSVTYGDEAEIIFRKVMKEGGVTSTEDVNASSVSMYLAARLSRAALSGAVAYESSAVAGAKYYYTDSDGMKWYFTAPVSGEAVFENGYALFGDDVNDYITALPDAGEYLLQAGTPAGVYLITMGAESSAADVACAPIEVLPRAVTLQVPRDLMAGESSAESAPDILFSQMILVSGSWADCDMEGDVFQYADESILPRYYNTAGTEFTAANVRKLCGAYAVIGTKELPNYAISFRSGQLTVLGAAYKVEVGTRPFDGLNVGKAYMLVPETGVASGPLNSPDQLSTQIQAGVRVVFSAQPDDGYEIYDWYINGRAQGSSRNTLVYTMMAEDTTVEVQFAIKQNTLTFGTAGDANGGTITCSDASLTSGSVVRQNAHFTFTAEANSGYHFKEWRYTEQGQGTAYDDTDNGETSSTFDFFMPAVSCSVYAVFERDGYVFNYIDGNNAKGLTASCIDEDGGTVTVHSGTRVKGGTQITVAPDAGYKWDLSRQYVSQGSQGTADYGRGTYTLTIDQDTTVYGWTLQQMYDLTLSYDLARTSDMVPDAVITYIIGDKDYAFPCEEYLTDGDKVIENIPGGSPVTVSVEYPGWVELLGWTGSGTVLKASTEIDQTAVTVVEGGSVQKNRSYVYTTGTDKYYFTSPVNGRVKTLSGEDVVLYASASTYTVPALSGDETLTVALNEKAVHTVTLADISADGSYRYTLPEGAFEDAANSVKVHDGDDFTVMVMPNQGKTVSYWKTTPEGGAPITRPATSLRYTIPSIMMDYAFEPIFSSTTYNLVSWPTISESQNHLSLDPESGYISSVAAGGDFKFKLSGDALPLVADVYANGNQFTANGTVVGETTYGYDAATGIYSIENLTENQEITVSFKTIGVTVNGVDVSALTGTGWTYDCATQVLTLSRAGLVLSGSNDRTLAPRLGIEATDAVGSLTLDSLQIESGRGAPPLAAEADLILTVSGSSMLTATASSVAVNVQGDLIVRGNGALETNRSVFTADDMQITGTVNLTIASEGQGIVVGNDLTVGAEGSTTASPVLRVSSAQADGASIVGDTCLYGGEASFTGAVSGIATRGDINCYDGILELYGDQQAVRALNSSAYMITLVHLDAYYDLGYMCRYQNQNGVYQTYSRLRSDYASSHGYDTILSITNSNWWNELFGNNSNKYYRLSPVTSTASEGGLTLSVVYEGTTYTTEEKLTGTTQGNLYYIVPGEQDPGIKCIDSSRLHHMDNQGLNLDPNAIVVAEYTSGNMLYFTRMKITELTQAIPVLDSNGQPTGEVTIEYDYSLDRIENATPLDYTVSGSISNHVGLSTRGKIVADGTIFDPTSPDGSQIEEKSMEIQTLTLDSLTHVWLSVACPVNLKGDNYLIGTAISEPLHIDNDLLDLHSDGSGTLTITTWENGQKALSLASGVLKLTDVAALTMIADPDAMDTGSVRYYHGEGDDAVELTYALGWLQDVGSKAGDAVTQTSVAANPTAGYVRFYVTSTDAKADPAALVYDKASASACVGDTTLTPPTVIGVPHLFKPQVANSGCKAELVTGSSAADIVTLSYATDYTYAADTNGITGTLTLNYTRDTFSALDVGEYMLRVFFYDEDPADATYYTLEIPLTVQDIEHVSGGLTARADKDMLTRGMSANITTEFTGTTPKVYEWSLVTGDGSEPDGVSLAPNGSRSTVTINDNAANGQIKVKVDSYADSEKTQLLGSATVDLTVVPKAISISITCATETPSGDESYMLYHNTIDGSVKSWDFDAEVTMDDGTPADPDRITWSVWGGTMAGTGVDPTGVLSIHPNETGLNSSGYLRLTARYTGADGSILEKTIMIRLSDDAIVGYSEPAAGGTIASEGIDPSGTPVPAGTAVTFTATPEDEYVVETWYINGQAVTDGNGYVVGENTMTFTTAKLGRYSIWASFGREKICAVTFEADGPGTVSAETDSGTLTSGSAVARGTEVTFTAVPDSLAAVTKWTVNGEDREADPAAPLTLTVSNDVEVVVSFEVPERSVTVTAGEHGSISFLVNGEAAQVALDDDTGSYILTVLATDTVTILAVPDDDYAVEEWSNLTNATASDAICMVLPGLGDATATVSFAMLPAYSVTVSANSYQNGWGTVICGSETVPMSESRTFTVAEGHSMTLTALPDAGSALYDWVIAPETYQDYSTDGNDLTLKNVNEDVTIGVTFRRGSSTLTLEKEGDGALTADYSLTVGTDVIENGSMSAPDSRTIRSGASVDVTLTPGAGQFLAAFTVNGEDRTAELEKAQTSVSETFRIDALTEDTVIGAVFEELVLFDITGHSPYVDDTDPETPVTMGTVEITGYGADNGFNTETGTDPQQVSVTPETAVEITFAPAEGYIVDTDALRDGVRAILSEAGSEAAFSFKQSANGTILCLEDIDMDLDFSELANPFAAKPEDDEFFTIRILAGENGTLTVENAAEHIRFLDGASVKAGTVLTYTAAADEHYVASVTVNSETAGESGSLTVTGDTSIAAAFTQSQYRVTVWVLGKGTGVVTIDGEEYAPGEYWFDLGTSLTVAAVAGEDSAIDTFQVNGNIVTEGSALVTVDGDVAVSASFSNAMRPVTYNVPANGTLKVIDAQGGTVVSGTSQRIGSKLYVIAVPDSHYMTKDLTVGGTDLTADYFTVDELRGNDVFCEFTRAEVSVSWTSVNSTVEAQLMPEGSSVTNGQYVPVGSNIKFIVTPKSSNYSEDSFTVTGAKLALNGWYTAEQEDIVANAVYKFTGDAPTTGVSVSWLTTGCTIEAQLDDGTVLTNGQKVLPGSRVKFTVTPAHSNYVRDSFVVLGATEDGDGYYVVGEDPVIVSAVYLAPSGGGPVTPPPPSGEYTIVIDVIGSGTLTVDNAGAELESGDQVALGSTLTIQATPEQNYRLASLTVNGVDFTNGGEYVVYANSVICAVFEADTAQRGLPCYTDSLGNTVFIGFAYDANGDGFYSEDEYIMPENVSIRFQENKKYFADMPGNWADEYIQFVGDRQIFQGVTENLFDPNGRVTRAMYVTVIGRLYENSFGSITANGSHSFDDCDYGSWYGKYVDWAASTGIVNGYGNRMFGPDDYVTREQMAAILYRFAQYLKFDRPISGQLTFTDSGSIADWAADSVRYCVGEGIINGLDDGSFAPKATATRAQMAALIVRFIQSVLPR